MEKITYGRYYHFFNRGTNKQTIFFDTTDYQHFFQLISIYLEPVADIYAYALMKNHFHFAIRVKLEQEIGFLNPATAKSNETEIKWKTYFPKNEEDKLKNGFHKKPEPDRMVQHFCTAYATYINSKYTRTGALLEHPYERIEVDNIHYLKRLILYIHNNPIKHGFCQQAFDYPWTSYLSYISLKPTKLSREKVIGYFDNQANFVAMHQPEDTFEDIEFLFLE